MQEKWKQQTQWIHRALADTTPIETNELLLPLSTEGQIVRKMTPDPGVVPREAAVLVLFYPRKGELWFPLTARSHRLSNHGGEVSLPGGAVDPDDHGPVATALRETYEELGVNPEEIEVWGFLSTIYIPASNFRLTPVVGFASALPGFCPCPFEIAEVFSVPVCQILNPSTVVTEEWTLHNAQAYVPFFSLNGYKVWGATALLLSELVARLRRVNNVHACW